MVPAVSSNARQRRRNLARHGSREFQQSTGGKTVTLGAYGWSKMGEGVVGNKIQPVVSPKIGENPDRVKWNSRRFQASIAGVPIGFRRRGWQGNDGRLLSFRLVPISAKKVVGNGRYVRVKVAGSGSGFRVCSWASLTASLSLSHTRVALCCSVFQLLLLLTS